MKQRQTQSRAQISAKTMTLSARSLRGSSFARTSSRPSCVIKSHLNRITATERELRSLHVNELEQDEEGGEEDEGASKKQLIVIRFGSRNTTTTTTTTWMDYYLDSSSTQTNERTNLRNLRPLMANEKQVNEICLPIREDEVGLICRHWGELRIATCDLQRKVCHILRPFLAIIFMSHINDDFSAIVYVVHRCLFTPDSPFSFIKRHKLLLLSLYDTGRFVKHCPRLSNANLLLRNPSVTQTKTQAQLTSIYTPNFRPAPTRFDLCALLNLNCTTELGSAN